MRTPHTSPTAARTLSTSDDPASTRRGSSIVVVDRRGGGLCHFTKGAISPGRPSTPVPMQTTTTPTGRPMGTCIAFTRTVWSCGGCDQEVAHNWANCIATSCGSHVTGRDGSDRPARGRTAGPPRPVRKRRPHPPGPPRAFHRPDRLTSVATTDRPRPAVGPLPVLGLLRRRQRSSRRAVPRIRRRPLGGATGESAPAPTSSPATGPAGVTGAGRPAAPGGRPRTHGRDGLHGPPEGASPSSHLPGGGG